MSDRKRIIVVDDEPDICDILRFNLNAEGYETDVVYSAEEAQKCELGKYDLVLLDIMMPGASGYDFADMLRKSEDTAGVPVIFISAKDAEEDLLKGFEAGADDYVTKPFSVREVLARVKAVLGRTGSGAKKNNPLVGYKGLVIDTLKKHVVVDGMPVGMTKTEYELLRLLLENQGHVFSRQDVLEKVWPKNVIVTDRTVDVNITRIRKKIGRYSSNIISKQGYGYLFDSL